MCESVKASKRKQNGTKSKKGCRDRRVRLSRRLAHNIRIKLESNFSSRSVDDFMITSVKSALRQTLYALMEKEEKKETVTRRRTASMASGSSWFQKYIGTEDYFDKLVAWEGED